MEWTVPIHPSIIHPFSPAIERNSQVIIYLSVLPNQGNGPTGFSALDVRHQHAHTEYTYSVHTLYTHAECIHQPTQKVQP